MTGSGVVGSLLGGLCAKDAVAELMTMLNASRHDRMIMIFNAWIDPANRATSQAIALHQTLQ